MVDSPKRASRLHLEMIASPDLSADPVQTDAATLRSCVVETLVEGRSAEEGRWQRLFARARQSRVHHHPDYTAAVVQDLPGEAWTIAAGADPSTMAILVPKRMSFGRQLLPGAVSSLWGTRLAGFGLLGEAGPTDVEDIVETLADEVLRRRIPVVEFEELDEASLLWKQIQRLIDRGFRPLGTFAAHHRIRLPETAEEYWGRFKSKSRSTLRRKRKKLGDYTVRCYRRHEEVDDFLEAAHAISVNTWQTHQLGLRVRADRSEQRYLQFLADRNALRSYVLFRGSDPVAFVLSHQWNGAYHYDELGFDRRLVALSPGNVLLQEIIDDLLRSDSPAVLDFGLGDADYKQFFADEQRRTATIRMFSPGFRGLWQTASIGLRNSVTHSARAMAGRFGLVGRLRRSLRNRAYGGN